MNHPVTSAGTAPMKDEDRLGFGTDERREWKSTLATLASSLEPAHARFPLAGSTVVALERCMTQWRDRALAAEKALATAQADERERLCVAIKAADDKAADADYMLDSDDCISVIRGTWKND